MIVTLFALLLSSAIASDTLPPHTDLLPDSPSYRTAVKRMYAIHEPQPFTLYCGCPFADKVPDLAVCHMSELSSSRAHRTEAEHVVPASIFGQTRSCWNEAPAGTSRRDYCAKVDPVFHAFYGDLHNLRPSVGAVNGARSNLPFGLIHGEERDFGSCDFEIDREDGVAEPAPRVRGNVARIWRYVDDLYGLPLTEGDRHLLLAWSEQDPPDDWERQLDALIKKQQGNNNPFVR